MMSESLITEQTGSPRHLNYLDGLRALAALYVMIGHVTILFAPWNHKPVFAEFFGYGHLAVDLFIALSGFSLALPVLDNGFCLRSGLREFFRRRAVRILPPYYAALLLSLGFIALYPGIWSNGAVTRLGLVSHVLLFQDLVGSDEINGVLWSISVEAHIYLLFPLMLASMRRFGLRPAAAVWSLAFLGMSVWTMTTPALRSCPQFVALFLSGVCAASLRRRTFPRWVQATLPTLSAAGLVLCALLWRRLDVDIHAARQIVPDALMALVLPGLLLAAGRPGSRLTALLSSRPLVVIGGFSYSIYLMHYIFEQYLCIRFLYPYWLLLGREHAYQLFIVVGLPVVVAWCYLFHLAFEKPFLRRSKSRIGPSSTLPHSAGPPAIAPPSTR